MMILKVTKKQSFTLSSDKMFFFKYILGLRHGFILNETSILAFAELAVFLFK